MIEPLALLVSGRELQAFLSPYSLDFLVIDVPALNAKQLGDLPIAVAAILFCEPDQRQTQTFIVIFRFHLILLR